MDALARWERDLPRSLSFVFSRRVVYASVSLESTVVATLLLFQLFAFVVLVTRLAGGRKREPPVAPAEVGLPRAYVSVLIPTLNEASRIGPLLSGLRSQDETMLEALVVDSASTDGTQELVGAAARQDKRIRLLTDPPLPNGWVGKVWALQFGLQHARGEFVLGLDADVDPAPSLVATVVGLAIRRELDVVSFSPKFAGQSAGERFVHPSLLLSLVYRAGAPAVGSSPERILANGQCFLVRREFLERLGGYAAARSSFADDVFLARHAARSGARVAFLDGSRLFKVRAYSSLGEMWREWGRSLDLRDATSGLTQLFDLAELAAVQGLPILILITAALGILDGKCAAWLLVLNLALLLIRVAMLFAIAPSYERRGLAYWLSPIADPLAFLRILWSSLRRPTTWRGRKYERAADVDSEAQASP